MYSTRRANIRYVSQNGFLRYIGTYLPSIDSLSIFFFFFFFSSSYQKKKKKIEKK